MILVYIVCKDAEEAGKIGRHLVEKRLAACTNSFPITSMYWWKGKIEESKESVLLAKTIDKKYSQIAKEVKKIHSYDVPCIMKLCVDVNKEYKDWLESEVK